MRRAMRDYKEEKEFDLEVFKKSIEKKVLKNKEKKQLEQASMLQRKSVMKLFNGQQGYGAERLPSVFVGEKARPKT